MTRMGTAARRPHPHPRGCSGSSLVYHRSNAPSNKVGITSMVGGNPRRAYYSRRCKKVLASNIASLPDEVLSEILVRLSADEICEKARFVCHNWYHIIHSDAFINAHRENSNSNWGLLLSNLYRVQRSLFLGVREGEIGMSELYHTTYFPIPASCNGLVLSIKTPKPYTINIINLATKQAFSLLSSIPAGEISHGTFHIAYAAASMEYKVVRTYARDPTQAFCHILTAGVGNKWRCVGVDNLSCGAKKLLLQDPLITQGFMHWTSKRQGTRVLTLNVETEVFTESYVPFHPHPIDDSGSRRRRMFYLSTGRHLSLLFSCGYMVWEVWETEGEIGEWRKLLPNIDLGSHRQRIDPNSYEPLGWIKYPVLLVWCNVFGSCYAVYNLDTDEFRSFVLDQPCRNYKAVVHRNTLEWLS